MRQWIKRTTWLGLFARTTLCARASSSLAQHAHFENGGSRAAKKNLSTILPAGINSRRATLLGRSGAIAATRHLPFLTHMVLP